jgi:predicted nucleic acid-binding protein
MKAALDTNVMLYAECFGDPHRVGIAISTATMMTGLAAEISTEACAELHFAMTRKFKLGRAQAADRLLAWRTHFSIRPVTIQGFESAVVLARDHAFQIFDAIILATAAESGCQLLLSEDMQDGFVWRGVTIVNPFAVAPHNLLKSYLETAP